MKKAVAFIATAASDRKLRKEFQNKGAKARASGVKREDCPVNGMIRTWWFEGWDGTDIKEAKPLSI